MKKLLYKHKGKLFYTCKTKCINMKQLLPLGREDCAFNSPRQICSLAPSDSLHFRKDQTKSFVFSPLHAHDFFQDFVVAAAAMVSSKLAARPDWFTWLSEGFVELDDPLAYIKDCSYSSFSSQKIQTAGQALRVAGLLDTGIWAYFLYPPG